MQRVAKFKKVSFGQFVNDSRKLLHDYESEFKNSLSIDEKAMAHIYADIKLPQRATIGSAGYDFYTPYEITLHPHSKVVIPSGIRCELDPNYMMLGVVRSSMGIKHDINLSNTCMVLDSDYFFADNEGHIMIALRNMKDYTVRCAAGERIMQGIFLPYGITADDDVEKLRTGGIGSTNA